MLILTWLGSFQGYSDLKQLLRKMSRSTRTLLMKNFNSIYQIVVFIFLLWSKGDHSQSVFGVFPHKSFYLWVLGQREVALLVIICIGCL